MNAMVWLIGLNIYFLVMVQGADFSYSSLQHVPWTSLGDEETLLGAQNNHIARVDWSPSRLLIEDVNLQSNVLQEFPNLVDAGRNSLHSLRLGNNLIRSIDPVDRLSKLLKLRYLGLKKNPLIAFPDADQFPPVLAKLVISDTLMVTLPNFCLLNTESLPSKELCLQTEDQQFTCDRSMLWGKIAFERGLLAKQKNGIILPMPVCGTPAKLNGMNLSETSYGALAANKVGVTVSSTAFERLPSASSLYCYPTITNIVPGLSVESCATKCLDNDLCLVFGVDGDSCILTEYNDGTAGTKGQFETYNDWYILRE